VGVGLPTGAAVVDGEIDDNQKVERVAPQRAEDVRGEKSALWSGRSTSCD